MGVITRPDSPFYWLVLERQGQRPIRESTKIVSRGLSPPRQRENRALAEQVYAARMGDLARQRHGLVVERPRLTFRAWADWYRAHVTPTKRSADRERSMIARLVAFLGAYLLEQVDAELAREYMTHRRAAVRPATVNRELDVLKSMMGSAVPKYLPTNPIAGVKRLRARSPEPRILTHEQERALLKVMAPADRALLIAALDTLLRQADLVGLKWAQDHRTYLEVVDPKREPYKVPVSARLRAALDHLPREGPYVFRHVRGGRRSANVIERMFRKACAAAGVPCGRPDGITWHGLRHTGATRAIAAGATLRDLMALGGWRDMKSMTRYLHPTGVDQALVDRMSRPPRARDSHAAPQQGGKRSARR